jgi:hypothetical protein
VNLKQKCLAEVWLKLCCDAQGRQTKNPAEPDTC